MTGKTPFDSVYKLEAIGQKAKSPDKIAWCVEMLGDMIQSGVIAVGELSVPGLTGKGRGGRGLLDLLLYKAGLADHVLNRWPFQQGCDLEQPTTSTHAPTAIELLHACQVTAQLQEHCLTPPVAIQPSAGGPALFLQSERALHIARQRVRKLVAPEAWSRASSNKWRVSRRSRTTGQHSARQRSLFPT